MTETDFDNEFPIQWSRAYGVGYVVLGDRAEAEDIAQEALARAFTRWDRIADYAGPWVVRVAGNLALDRVRRRRRTIPPGRAEVPGPDGLRVDLQAALLRLPKRQRECVVLRHLADLPEADVARVLGCSVGTVKTHTSRGLSALRGAMGAGA